MFGSKLMGILGLILIMVFIHAVQSSCSGIAHWNTLMVRLLSRRVRVV